MDTDARKQAVKDFLQRCVEYADASIARKRERAEGGEGDESEISRWTAYREFTAYAISELDSGELDPWFDEQAESPSRPRIGGGGTPIESSPLWLSALVAPRPMALLSTRSSAGVDNLCPVSSLNILANRPPLLGVSLSVDSKGRQRDSLVNLRDGSAASLLILPATWEAARLVEATATPLPPEESEWGLLDAEPTPDSTGRPAIHPDSVAVIECSLAELHPLPSGSVATLAILGVERILLPDELSSDEPDLTRLGALLAQHGNCRLVPGPGPDDWSFMVGGHESS